MALLITNIRPTAPTTAGGWGSLLFDVTGAGACDLLVTQRTGSTALLVQNNVLAPLTDVAVNNLPPGPYRISALEYATGVPVYAEAVVPRFVPIPVYGCTDPRALNLVPGANQDDGSCVYTPPAVPDPVFVVPPLLGLRFVQVETPDDCATFETPDNALFCQQRRPGMQRRPLYVTPVNFCDPVAVQVLTNFPSVEAIVHEHRTGQVLRTQPLTRVQVLQGPAPFVQVELGTNADGNTVVISATGGLPASLLAAARVTLRLDPAGTLLTYRVLSSGRASATVNDDYLIINRPGAPLPAGTYAYVSWELVGPGFNVWETNVDLTGLPAGTYEIRLHGYDAANHSATAISEPLHWAQKHDNTVLVEWRNADNCFSTVFTTGLTPRMRVPGTFFRVRHAGTRTVHRNSDDSAVVLASTAQRLIPLEVYQVPAHVHETLQLVTRLDYLQVNGLRCVAAGDYEVSEVRTYPLSSGSVPLEQQQWLGAGNADDVPNDTGDTFLVLRSGGFLKLRG